MNLDVMGVGKGFLEVERLFTSKNMLIVVSIATKSRKLLIGEFKNVPGY